MLLVKPCVVYSRQPSEDEKDANMIEMEMNNDDDDNQQQSDDAINEGGSMTEESELMEGGSQMDIMDDKEGQGLVAKRQNELRSLDQ